MSYHPFFRIYGEFIYYGLIAIAIVLSLTLIKRKLFALGYEKKKLTFFIYFCAVVSFPAGYLGSRAASMFYYPPSRWSIDFLIENILSGSFHTYHASLILPIIIISVCIIFLRFNYFEVFDAIFLTLPLAHAIGRGGCLAVGCCWGRYFSLHIFGFHYRFPNPIPLYAIIINSIIFLFLVRLYEKIYTNPHNRQLFRGAILGSYLLLYGVFRLFLELFRTEKRIFLSLTQAQLTMIVYIMIGLIVFLIIYFSGRRWSNEVLSDKTDTDIRAKLELKHLLSLMSFVAGCLLLFFVFYYVTRKLDLFQWPFHKAVSVSDAYMQVYYYLPVIILPMISLYWLKKENSPIIKSFKWSRFSIIFFITLFVSVYYSVDLLILREPKLKGLAFWPPIVILSVLNAFSEEIVFRLTAFSMVQRAGYSSLIANTMQSLLYSLSHFLIAGVSLGIMSFFYGLILGQIYDRDKSIMPCIICHFIIDIGCIGLPILRA